MKKMILMGAFVLGAVAFCGQMTNAQACDGSCKKPKTSEPAPAPAPKPAE